MEKADQLNIDGEWEPTDPVPDIKPTCRSLKGQFRDTWGTLEGCDLTCGDCIHCVTILWGDRRFIKCEMLGISYSSSTTIRKCDKPCALFKKIPYNKGWRKER